MSYVEIYAVRENGDVERYAHVPNATAGAMLLWRKLGAKYRLPINMVTEDGFDVLWAFANAGHMSVVDTIAIRATYDNVIVPSDVLGTVANALLTVNAEPVKRPASIYDFSRDDGDDGMFAESPTLIGMAAVLTRAANDPDVHGIAFNQTSVTADPLWLVRDDDTEEDRPYNIMRDEGHWFLSVPRGAVHLERLLADVRAGKLVIVDGSVEQSTIDSRKVITLYAYEDVPNKKRSTDGR